MPNEKDKDLLISATGTYKLIRDPADCARKDGQLPVALGVRDAAVLKSILGAVDKAARQREGSTLSLPQSALAEATVLKVRPAREEGWAVVSVKALGNEAPLPDQQLLADLYRLTPTECQTAIDLMRHDDLSDIAVERGGSIETVRMHVKNLLRKTNMPSQKGLIALLTRLAAYTSCTVDRGTEASGMSLRAIQRTFICLLALLGAVLLPAAALAVDNLSITIATTPIALGKIVRSNSAATTFTVTNAGAVSVTSGAGVRVTTGTVSALSLSLDCRLDATTTKCTTGNKTYTLTVTAGSSSGGDTLNKFSYGSIGSTGSLVGSAPAAANPLSFQLQVKSGQTWPITVTLGYEFGVSTTATRGSASAPYTVTLTEN